MPLADERTVEEAHGLVVGDKPMCHNITGVVRAPLTGIVLATEMTADVTLLLPMLGACAMAMLTPTLLKDPPIYDSLRERTVARERARLERTARAAPERK